jgi:hypothetical protein
VDDPLKEISGLLLSLSANVERLAVAVEKQNEFGQKLMKCPRCLGDGQGYSKQRCIGCGGTGTKQ